ncbi:MAG: diguanylate cyclase [Phycisphaerales bacterium]|nr:diguanylate cyclase [Phycisphaerales bacterium]
MPRTRILLVEDDPDHRFLLRAALSENDPEMDVHVTESGEAARRLIREDAPRKFDCILLDYYLPDYNAAQLLPLLSQEGVKCPMLVLSSSTEQSVTIESLRQGSVDFIPKAEALRAGSLCRRVNLAVAEHRKQNENRRWMERRVNELMRLSEEEPLTGVANRRCLNRLLGDQRQTLDRRGSTSIAMLDLDHFKRINDTYGHAFGDQVLRSIGEVIRDHTTHRDLPCRYGGEEFLVVRPTTNYAEAVRWAERVRTKIQELVFPCGTEYVKVTTSIGIAVCEQCRLTEDKINEADLALYFAKQRGRNRVCTAEMAAFHELTKKRAGDLQGPPHEQLQRLLESDQLRVGPTQLEHLTTHARSVSRIAVRLAEALRINGEQRHRLRVAGLCHDIGKLVIPEVVLAKPTALSEDERLLINRHSADGAEMAGMLGADDVTARLIQHHHTRFDRHNDSPGSSSKTLPLGARILAVADAFVTMTSERPYQHARSHSSAVLELQRNSGTQFDPEVVKAVTRALRSQLGVPAKQHAPRELAQL